MNEIEVFKNNELGMQARMITNPDGSISISAEDTAIGFGWIQTQNKNGKEYISVRWERMNGFSAECGFPHSWGKDDYIPESLFYRLGMKANNVIADRFQNWLAFEVIPSIRKTGTYSMAKYKPKATSVGEVANLLKILERTMKAEKQSPEVIAKNIEQVCKQFGIELSEDFTKRNDNGQMAFVIVGVK